MKNLRRQVFFVISNIVFVVLSGLDSLMLDLSLENLLAMSCSLPVFFPRVFLNLLIMNTAIMASIRMSIYGILFIL